VAAGEQGGEDELDLTAPPDHLRAQAVGQRRVVQRVDRLRNAQ
jgi:hypothetical protein